jgi:glucokinase
MHGAIFVADVGATWIRAGLSTDARPRTAVPTGATSGEIIVQICQLVAEIGSDVLLDALAIGCPGLVSKGTVLSALYVDLSGVPLASQLAERTGRRTVVINDVDGQAMGDAGYGTEQSYFLISAGTAVGGAFVQGGVLVTGRRGSVSEIGHVPCADPAQKCRCGGLGCLDVALSGAQLEQKLGVEWWQATRDETAGELSAAGAAASRATRCVSVLHDLDYVHLVGRVFLNPIVMAGFATAHSAGLGTDVPVRRTEDGWKLAARGLGRAAQESCAG